MHKRARLAADPRNKTWQVNQLAQDLSLIEDTYDVAALGGFKLLGLLFALFLHTLTSNGYTHHSLNSITQCQRWPRSAKAQAMPFK